MSQIMELLTPAGRLKKTVENQIREIIMRANDIAFINFYPDLAKIGEVATKFVN
ncbi:MAG: hypothetical protein GY793_07005 [Proteobacteria bacterium]|nr:hypothetical protein [Pseudomonadota bacterium]